MAQLSRDAGGVKRARPACLTATTRKSKVAMPFRLLDDAPFVATSEALGATPHSRRMTRHLLALYPETPGLISLLSSVTLLSLFPRLGNLQMLFVIGFGCFVRSAILLRFSRSREMFLGQWGGGFLFWRMFPESGCKAGS